MSDINKIFKVKPQANSSFTTPQRQVPEEDYAVRKNINTQEGTVEKVPVNSNDIVNKAYVDGIAGGFPEGTDVKSTGVGLGSYLRSDGDNTSSWQAVVAGDSLPDQTGHAGSYLYTDGTDASWEAVSGGSGDPQDLQDVTDTGNTTTNNIIIQDDHAGLLTSRVHNTNNDAITIAGAVHEVKNDLGYWGLQGMTSSTSTIGAGAFVNTFHNYNQGYGDTLFTVDGNKSFKWFSDPTDSHNFSALSNSIMTLNALGSLTISGNITGNNLSGTNTGDQDLSDYFSVNDGTFAFQLTDNTAEAFKLYQGTNGYICASTTNGSEEIKLGCGPTNPSLVVKIDHIKADDIREYTADNGVEIEGVVIKDGEVDGIDIATDVAANTAKTGITTAQANAITANTAKVSYTGVADDHGTASTDQIVNVCYGTSDTPPTASTTTEGALYIQYTA